MSEANILLACCAKLRWCQDAYCCSEGYAPDLVREFTGDLLTLLANVGGMVPRSIFRPRDHPMASNRWAEQPSRACVELGPIPRARSATLPELYFANRGSKQQPGLVL